MVKKGLFLTGMVLALGLLMGAVGCALPTGAGQGGPVSVITNTQPTGISVTGVGEIILVPDVAMLRLGVEARASTVEEARRKAAEAMDKVVAQLKSGGVAEKDVKTTRFSITPERRFDRDGKEIFMGYRVNNIVTAKIRKVDDAGKLVDAATSAGGDVTRVEGISFTVDDPTKLEVQLRDKAMADAKAKGEQLAKLAGVTLGKPISVSESRAGFPIEPIRAALELSSKGADMPPTPISPGETEVRLTVQVVYSIG